MPRFDSSHFDRRRIGWGDTVRVRTTPETEAAGVAGRRGAVFGQTTPSEGFVDHPIIGAPAEDYAVNVYFDDLKEGFWFAEDLLEFVDHTPGATMELGGRCFVRDANGEWHEVPKDKS